MCQRWVIVVGLAAFASGCGGSSPPASEQAPAQSASARPAPVPEVSKKQPERSPAEEQRPMEAESAADATTAKTRPSASSETPRAPLDSQLRLQLGALIVPGAAGRWQVDDATATALEKSAVSTDTLLIAARDQDAKVRRGAWHQLAENFDIRDVENQAQLRAALADEDAIVRALAFRIVADLPDQELPTLVPPLGQLLSSEELTTENRAAIARLLGRLKEQAKEAEEPLAQAARDDKQARVRSACLVALWQIAEPAANLPRFRAALQDSDASVRVVAAARLREMGPEAAIAAEGLARSLEDSDERVREASAEALLRIGEPAVKPLMGELTAESPAARRWAVYALAKLGPVAKPAFAELEKVSNNPREEEETRKMAALALKRLGS